MPVESLERFIETGFEQIGSGREEAWTAKVEDALVRHKDDARLWQLLALLNRAAENLADAVRAFERANRLAPEDARIALGLAQCRSEAGLPAEAEFRNARSLAPGDLAIAQGWIAAIAAEQGASKAIGALRPLLGQHPGWVAGHWQMTRLLGSSGSSGQIDLTLSRAARARPFDNALWHHWIFTLMKMRRFDDVLAIIEEARGSLPSDRQLAWSRAACLTESGALDEATRAYAELGPVRDMGNAIFEARHLLRSGRADVLVGRASAITDPANLGPLFPYFSLAWRLTGDPALRWFEPPDMIGIYDLAEELAPLHELAEFLRSIHTQSEPPIEQSVRNGTQTDGPLLSRIDPLIQQLRKTLLSAIRRYLEQLPPVDPRHLQLRFRRDAPIRFAGSWSVRLRDAGHHEQHVHPEGWFSSAFYVALPHALGGSEGQQGWLTLGQPQDSLGLKLKPLRTVEPKLGRLVLFPSTMWHGTLPFDEGERLTVAFDVRPPA